MLGYVVRRLILGALTVIAVATFLFFLLQLLPVHWYDALVNRPNQSPADRQALLAHYGVDQPLWIQYARYVQNLLSWPPYLGYSEKLHVDIGALILSRAGPTAVLMGISYVVQLVVAVPIGVISALRPYTRLDNTITAGAFLGISLPNYWFGTMLIVLFALVPVTHGGTPILPNGGFGDMRNLADLAWHLVLPVTVLAFQGIAQYARYTRSAMLDVLGQDYIRTARAKGLLPFQVVIGHALRNCLLPIITLIGLDLPQLFVGAVVTEFVFNWQGMGQLFINEAGDNDIPVLMAIILILSTFVVIGNLIADLAYTRADPRIRLGEGHQ